MLRQMYQAVTRCISSWLVIQAPVECFVCGLKQGELGAIQWTDGAFKNTVSVSREVNKKYPLQPLSLLKQAKVTCSKSLGYNMGNTEISFQIWKEKNIPVTK